ncbi:predicted protein [Naegleria gruberi]|uniref:Predicted protein n=1 Tax=Naegleria gruberi TaxID=5762 RepID=D2UZH8_NAEGR|nr:uncharacterized protein NAEGRDRAFT_61942 [Naegleria gruberi]EFC49948.1 predicted protein [Naegleria gruberi]|eukprot:XP_002682692.1 predicted protein [Naegleria gruberi strain NEG-M]
MEYNYHAATVWSAYESDSSNSTAPLLLVPYDMRMSSMDTSCGNNLENLNEEDGMIGVCTGELSESEEFPFIQLIFRDSVRIERMIIGACSLDVWGNEYLQGCQVQYLTKGNEWQHLAIISLDGDNPDCEIILKSPIETNSIRVKTDSEYIGLGKWKCFGQVVGNVTRGLDIEKFPLDQSGTSFIDMISIPYRVKMSSKFANTENTFASLVDASDLSVGAATNNDINSYIEAVFLTPAQPITHIAINSLTKKDWGVKYSHNLLLEYSDNGVDWKVLQKLTDVHDKSAPISLAQAVVSTHWRVRRVEEGYVALGLFKFYTYHHMYNESVAPSQPTISKPLTYTITMSDADESLTNTYQSLQDPSGKSSGAGTLASNSPFIQISFDRVYKLVSLDIRPIRKPDWGTAYLSPCCIKYSENGTKWFDSVSLSNISQELTTIVLDNISAKHLRIVKEPNEEEEEEESYIGVGSLIVRGF